MTWWQWVLIGAAGAVGAPLRYVVDTLVSDRVAGVFPLGTLTVNVSGSFLLGLLSGLVIYHGLTRSPNLILGTGLIGAYTTFSTFSFETIALLEEGEAGLAVRNVVTNAVVGAERGGCRPGLGRLMTSEYRGVMTVTANRAQFRSFEESTQEDWALITPQLNLTQSLVPAHVLEQMRYLRNDHGGFPVDRLEHSLQTATRAERDGRDEEYVLCALLHDIGDTLSPFNHPAVAAAILKPFVSKANLWMVEHHGIFQGYYFWHYIGLDKNAREAYRDSPYFEYTEEFCAKYDQTAFDPEYRSEPLEHFEPLVRARLVTSIPAR